ncbi:MAG: GAF domain-containing sensor histidine kinase [Synechococcaceae cyanobacterium SM2_3_1]|nr:GAF domain-containing sensor histidine kinase [Synechococcaceae cyanobacterium SM2_3_1]
MSESVVSKFDPGQVPAHRDQLLSAIARIRKFPDLPTVFATAVQEVRQLIQVDRVIIYGFDESFMGTVVAESVGAEWTPSLGMEIIDTCFRETRAAQYASKYTIQVLPDVTQAGMTACHLELLQRLEVKAKVVVPIVVGNQVWGLLIAHQCSCPRSWRETEVVMLMQIATQITVAIQQAESIRIEKELALERQALAKQERLLQVIARIPRPLIIQETLDTTVTELRRLLEADRVVIYRFTPSGEGDFVAESVLSEWISLRSENQNLHALMAHIKTFSQNCLSETESDYLKATDQGEHSYSLRLCMINDVQKSDFNASYLAVLEQIQAKACIMVGIVLDHKLWGLLAVYQNSGPRYWNQAEINLTDQVATQLTIALRHLILYQKFQDQIQHLETLNQLKDDFFHTVSHEVRTPLASIRVAIKMLKCLTQKEMMAISEPSEYHQRVQRYLNILDNECDREINLVEDLLSLNQLDAPKEAGSMDTIDLNTYLPKLVSAFTLRAQDHHLQLLSDIEPDLPLCYINKTNLDRILNELLNNACKYTPPAGEVILRAGSFLNNVACGIRVIISNTAEIPVSELPHLFDKFYRVPHGDPWQRGGTGLGLFLVKGLVEISGGEITVTSQYGWTTFSLWLPLGSSS